MSESDVQKGIMDFLQYNKIYCQRINSGKMFASYRDKNGGFKQRAIKLADVGTPDIITCIDGKFICFEVKKDEKEVEKWHKKVTKFLATAYIPPSYQRDIDQYKQHELIRKSGGEVYVVGSIDMVGAIVQELRK